MRQARIAQKGSVLFVLIVAMISMGTLGASMYLLTTTSTYGTLFSNKANQALLLAESGIRYDQKASLADGTVTITLNGGVDRFIITKTTDLATGVKTTVSTGIADANSTWPVRKRITYVSGSPGTSGPGPGPPAAVPMTTVSGHASGSTGTFGIGAHHGNPNALNVTGSRGNINNPHTYPEAYGTPTWTTNPFCQPWTNMGGFLSYDVQIKVAEEHGQPPEWNASTTYYLGDLVWYQTPTNYFDCRAAVCTTNPTAKKTQWGPVVYVFNLGVIFRVSATTPQAHAYGVTYFRSTLYTDGGAPIDGVPATMMPDNLPDNDPALVLFTRDGSSGSDNHWLAYMPLAGANHVVDQYGFLKDWSSIVVRVVEAASIKLTATSAPDISDGDQVTGGAGSATVIRKISDSDDRVVLLLNNVSGAFTSPVTVGGQSYATSNGWGDAGAIPAWRNNTAYQVGDWVVRSSIAYRCIQQHTSTNATRPDRAGGKAYWLRDTPGSFYRPRDNYIWAFFADTDNHTAYNATATDNTRREKDLFPDDLSSFTPPFPLADVQAWDAANDDYTLATWATGSSNLNTSIDPSLRLLGRGKELNAIIRTNRWVTGSYPADCSAFPPEIGIISKGTTSMQNAYDDLAYRILHGAGAGGAPSAGYYDY
ncbi:MAG: carbohydrate-binding protein [Thermodesulfobacteriota bacterium]